MTQIINVLNNGNKNGAATGVVKVNSFNVSPNTITAAPSPATIPDNELNLYDFWQVQRTLADTDEFDLPDQAGVGSVITLYAVTGFELRTETDADKINNVASKGYTAVTGDVLTCTKVIAGSWIVNKVTILGADTTVVAGV